MELEVTYENLGNDSRLAQGFEDEHHDARVGNEDCHLKDDERK